MSGSYYTIETIALIVMRIIIIYIFIIDNHGSKAQQKGYSSALNADRLVYKFQTTKLRERRYSEPDVDATQRC
jgi:hypothetical protein